MKPPPAGGEPAGRSGAGRRGALFAEFLALYLGIPLIVHDLAKSMAVPVLVVLMPAAVLCLGILLRDPAFDRRRLWNLQGLAGAVPRLTLVFAASAAALALLVWRFDRPALLSLPREAPLLWGLIVVLYPLVSVYPQEVVYRAFLFHRYRTLFPTPAARVVISALAFGFVHIVFGNWVAVALTVAGGFLFASTYRRTGSLAAVTVEHSLYGALIFTVGLGAFFFHGTRWLAARLAAGL